MPNPNVSTVVDAPVEEVWTLLRPFDKSNEWHPSLPPARIIDDQPADTIGCVRVFDVNGTEVRERLLELDDDAHVCRYALEQSTMPVTNYVGTLQVSPEGEGRSLVQWSAQFDCAADAEEQLTGVFEQGIFGPGLEALRDRFA